MSRYNISKGEAKKSGQERYKINKDGSRKSGSKGKSSEKDFREFLKDRDLDKYYDALSSDMKEMVAYNYTIQSKDQKDKVKKLEEALEGATEQAAPYWKSVLRVAQDEITRAVTVEEEDYETNVDKLDTRISELKEDLSTNKDFLSLEEQSSLASQLRSYEGQRNGIIEQAAEAGLTFSTKRKQATEELKTESDELSESTKRRYAKQVGDITTATNRGVSEAELNKEAAEKAKNRGITDIGRKGEQALGTENIPNIDGYKPLGDVSGDLYEEKVKDIDARKQGIFDESIQKSLNFNF